MLFEEGSITAGYRFSLFDPIHRVNHARFDKFMCYVIMQYTWDISKTFKRELMDQCFDVLSVNIRVCFHIHIVYTILISVNDIQCDLPFLYIIEGDLMDYETLENKPSINGVELKPGMELEDIGIVEMSPEMVSELFFETFGYIL